MGLALFTEASGALLVGWRHKVPSWSGLRSPGKKVNSESLCATGNQPEKKRRERERKTQRPELWWSGIRNFIFKRNFYTLSYTFLKVKDTESAQHSINFTFIKTRTFSVHLFINKGLMLCLALWPVNISWLLSDKGWSARKLLFPKSVFFFISPSLRKY